MAYVGSTITVTRTGWADIEAVLVEKDVDGGGYSEVGIYTVPREIVAGSGEVEEIIQYTFAYQYTLLLADVGSLTLRFTPIAPEDDSAVFTHGPITVEAVPSLVAQNGTAVGCGVSLAF